MNITSQEIEKRLSELELPGTKLLSECLNHLLVLARQIHKTTETSNSTGKQGIPLSNGSVFQTFVPSNTQVVWSFSQEWLNDPSTNTDPYQRLIDMDTQSTEASLARNKIYIDKMKERLLGTLPETLTKETNMFHDDCFAIPTPKCNPYPYKNGAGTSTVGPINMAVTLPTQQDPAAKGKDHLLSRAVTALSDKDFELRKLYNLIPDDDPETIKDFIQRIKDGKFTTDLTEKEQAESKFYSTQRLLEEIMWQDPARKEDDEGFKAAQKVLRQAYNDVCDEIVVKTPDQGLESLRAFQAKTFN